MHSMNHAADGLLCSSGPFAHLDGAAGAVQTSERFHNAERVISELASPSACQLLPCRSGPLACPGRTASASPVKIQ